MAASMMQVMAKYRYWIVCCSGYKAGENLVKRLSKGVEYEADNFIPTEYVPHTLMHL